MKNHNPIPADNHSQQGTHQRLPLIFSARLFPHRSLNRNGFILLMTAISIVCFGLGGFFLAIGAWPVFGFFGLDVLVIYLAFRINFKDATAFEEISISRDEMLVLKCPPNGRCNTYRFNPSWTRFLVNRHDEFGITDMEIASRKSHLRIGDFLNPEDRESFASAFGAALATAKR